MAGSGHKHSQTLPPMTKNNRNKKSTRRRPRTQAVSNVTRAVRDLQLATQQVVLPNVRDIMPTPINRRQLYTFERAYSQTFTGANVQIVQPSLSDFPNASEFTTLFQRYRFLWFTVEFQVTNNVAATGYASDSATFVTFTNPVPGSVSDLQQLETYQNHGSPLAMVKIKRSFTPHTNPVTNGATSGVQIVPSVRMWYTTEEPTQSFYGLYVFVVGGSATAVDYIVRAGIQFQNPF